MNADWNFCLSIITAVVAVVALWQTHYQVRINNKQRLFDRRMKVYTIADGLMKLYLSNRDFFYRDKEEEPQLAIDLHFTWLTNNTYLESISSVIKNPLRDPTTHKAILIKLEEIKTIANETKFLFSGESSLLLSEFITNYQRLLFAIYQYQILLNNMKENADKWKWTLEKASERLNEPIQRKELYAAIDDLKKAYETAKSERIMEKIENQIRFIKRPMTHNKEGIITQ